MRIFTIVASILSLAYVNTAIAQPKTQFAFPTFDNIPCELLLSDIELSPEASAFLNVDGLLQSRLVYGNVLSRFQTVHPNGSGLAWISHMDQYGVAVGVLTNNIRNGIQLKTSLPENKRTYLDVRRNPAMTTALLEIIEKGQTSDLLKRWNLLAFSLEPVNANIWDSPHSLYYIYPITDGENSVAIVRYRMLTETQITQTSTGRIFGTKQTPEYGEPIILDAESATHYLKAVLF